jgi:hypothetical protein
MNLLRKEITLKQKCVLTIKKRMASTSTLAFIKRYGMIVPCGLMGLFGMFAMPANALLVNNLIQNPHKTMTIAESALEWKLNASNSTPLSREHELIRVPAANLPEGLLVDDNLLILVEQKDGKVPVQSLPYQWATSASFSEQKELLIQASFKPHEHKRLRIIKLQAGSFEKQNSSAAYAELAVRFGGTMNNKMQFEGGTYSQVSEFQLPSDHTIGNKLFKYEGFGWESELVGYRYYFDNRGAVDIFGKQQVGLALKEVGLDGDDYHALDEWGMDVLKVGGSLGLGALGAYVDGEIVKVTDFQSSHVSIRNDAIYASAMLSANAWQVGDNTYDLQVTYRIAGGQRLTEVIGDADGLNHWASGIVNHVSNDKSKADVKLMAEGISSTTQGQDTKAWCYRATYGKQSLNDDNLGMALFYPCENSTLIDSELNIAVAMQGSMAHYYFLAGWEAENSLFASEARFSEYLKQTQTRLNKQIEVTWQN